MVMVFLTLAALTSFSKELIKIIFISKSTSIISVQLPKVLIKEQLFFYTVLGKSLERQVSSQ
jgi:hypothetical protein